MQGDGELRGRSHINPAATCCRLGQQASEYTGQDISAARNSKFNAALITGPLAAAVSYDRTGTLQHHDNAKTPSEHTGGPLTTRELRIWNW